MAIVVGVIAVAVLAAAGVWLLQDKPTTLRLPSTSESQSVDELEALNVTLKATAEGLKNGDWTYELLSVTSPVAKISGGDSGVFTWSPSEALRVR